MWFSDFFTYLLGSNERKEHVECNLDSIDEDKTMLGGDEFEVHSVDNWPNLPRTLYGSEKIILDFISNSWETVSGNKSEVGEENSHEEWTPDDLIDEYLGCNCLTVGSRDLFVEPVVEVMS